MSKLIHISPEAWKQLNADAMTVVNGQASQAVLDELNADEVDEILENYNFGLHTKSECFNQIADLLVRSRFPEQA